MCTDIYMQWHDVWLVYFPGFTTKVELEKWVIIWCSWGITVTWWCPNTLFYHTIILSPYKAYRFCRNVVKKTLPSLHLCRNSTNLSKTQENYRIRLFSSNLFGNLNFSPYKIILLVRCLCDIYSCLKILVMESGILQGTLYKTNMNCSSRKLIIQIYLLNLINKN